MTDKSIPKVIIPAAGFGKRVGQPSAKELLFYKEEKEPIICWSIYLCKKFGLEPLVISRKDKLELNGFLEKNSIPYYLIESSEEWTHTVLLSSNLWNEKNLLLLPDSRFQPTTIIQDLILDLDHFDLSFACFNVEDPSSWGILKNINNEYQIAEKPLEKSCNDQAWGLISFRKEAGLYLFECLRQSSQSHKYYSLNKYKINKRELASFEDITRNRNDLFSE